MKDYNEPVPVDVIGGCEHRFMGCFGFVIIVGLAIYYLQMIMTPLLWVIGGLAIVFCIIKFLPFYKDKCPMWLRKCILPVAGITLVVALLVAIFVVKHNIYINAAIQRGDVNAVRHIGKPEPDNDTISKFLETCRGGDRLGAARMLCKYDNEILLSACEPDGIVALHIAAKQGDVKLAELLLSCGANIDEPCRETLDEWGNVNSFQEFTQYTALMFAGSSNQPGMMECLIKNGANIKLRDGEGMNALMHAAYDNHPKIVKILIDNGIDVNTPCVTPGGAGMGNDTALTYAYQQGNSQIAKILIKAGAHL